MKIYDLLYIFNTRSLRGKELTNLIGRVNRLHEIFKNGNIQLTGIKDTKDTEYIAYHIIDKIKYIYNNIDVLVFPTKLKEGLGLVGLESMACSTPVIASNSSGPATYVQEGKNGFLFRISLIAILTQSAGVPEHLYSN